MAILNYVNQYDSVKNYVGLTSTDSNYIKLVFTGDGHIITHGYDYTADYLSGKRGLVPNYSIDNFDYGVLTKEGWAKLTTTYLPVNDETTSLDNLWSSQRIVNYFAEGIAANDAMVIVGTVDGDGIIKSVNTKFINSDKKDKNFNTLTNYSSGWTFRVVDKGGTVVGKTVEIGDMIMCVTDYTTYNDAHWSVIQTNINGTTLAKINGMEYNIYTTEVKDTFEFYAPKTQGSSGQVLVSTGSDLEWRAQSTLDAGLLGGTAKDDLLTAVTASDGTITVTVGGITKTSIANGNWSINADTATKVNHSLKTSGDGLNQVDYDGSSEKTIQLLAATNTTLGGVIIGENISLTDGKISITATNIEAAIGKDLDSIASNVIVSNKTKGLAPEIGTSAGNVNESFMFLAYDPNNVGVEEEREAKWYKLPTNVLGNSWRPIKINGTNLFDSSNEEGNILNFKPGNLITIVQDETNAVVISTEAEVNQNAFSSINLGNGNEITASAKTDTLTFTGTNVTISGTSGDKQINFAVADFSGATSSKAGSKGLVPAPAAGDTLKFLRGDGTWVIPTNTNTWRKITVGENSLGNATDTGDLKITGSNNIAVTLTGNILNIASTYVDHIYEFKTGLSSSTSNNTTTVALKLAATDEIGGIKIAGIRTSSITTTQGTSAASRYYGVEVDKDGKAFVNVPWTDTNIRDIQINGESIGTKTLNIRPSEDVVISWDRGEDANDEDSAATISFGLSWYNMDTQKYETA